MIQLEKLLIRSPKIDPEYNPMVQKNFACLLISKVDSCSEVISAPGSGSGLVVLPRSQDVSGDQNIVGLGLGTLRTRQIRPMWADTKIISITYPEAGIS